MEPHEMDLDEVDRALAAAAMRGHQVTQMLAHQLDEPADMLLLSISSEVERELSIIAMAVEEGWGETAGERRALDVVKEYASEDTSPLAAAWQAAVDGVIAWRAAMEKIKQEGYSSLLYRYGIVGVGRQLQEALHNLTERSGIDH